MEISERKTLDEVECGLVVGMGFAGEAGDHVGADGGVGKLLADEFDAAGVMLRAVTAVHGGEDAVRAGLQRHVEMLGEAIGGSEKSDEIPGDILRLNGGKAEAREVGFAKNEMEKRQEICARREIAAVAAEIDAGENDFTRGVGRIRRSEGLNFADDGVRGEAPRFAAHEGDDAVGAAEIAAVLDFQSGASVAGLVAVKRSGEEFGVGENVADEDLSRLGRFPRGKEGMEGQGGIRDKRA